MKEFLTTAVIRKPYGVKGDLKVRPFSDDISHFFKLKEVTVEKDGIEKHLEIERVQDYQGEVLIKFKGLDNPEDAKLYSGFNVLVPRNLASGLKKGEVYTADLIGLVLMHNGEESGVVESLIEGAQALLLEVKCTDGKYRLVPYLKGVFVGEADLEKGTLELLKKELVQ